MRPDFEKEARGCYARIWREYRCGVPPAPDQMIAALLRSTWNRALEAGADKAPYAIYAAEIRALKVSEDD
jgi:hypothetical protein